MNIWRGGDELNRRVKVEQFLFNCANGKKPQSVGNLRCILERRRGQSERLTFN